MDSPRQEPTTPPAGPIPIEDLADSRLDPFRSLRARTEAGEELAVADGLRVLETLMRLGVAPTSLLVTPESIESVLPLLGEPAPPVYQVSKELASTLVGYRYHKGVMATLAPPRVDHSLDELGDRVVVLARLEKGENVGAIARSALAFGFTGVLVDAAGATPFGRSAIRASRGAVCGLATRITEDLAGDLATLRASGMTIVGATQYGAVCPSELAERVSGPVALVLGNEGEGLPVTLEAQLAVPVRVPIDARVESLNVGAAAAILFFALRGE